MRNNLIEKKPKYYLNQKGEFVIENYNFSKPFANFFPGIAGKYGIPMWVFYVNRSQGIISFGTKDKNHSILEFQPANKAWQLAPSCGFRTFIKVASGKNPLFYEPFHNGFTNLQYAVNNRMLVSQSELSLEENNQTLRLGLRVEYFNIPNDSYAGLARVVTIKNLSRQKKSLQVIDGLPQIIPYGTANLFLKKLSRTIEAWMQVKNLENGVPFYKLDVDPTDRPEVIRIAGGNFYLGFHYDKEKVKVIKPMVDPQSIFGEITDFSFPRKFLSTHKFVHPKKELSRSKTPCGFLLLNLDLSPGQEKAFYSVLGYMRSQEMLNSSISKITTPSYLPEKRKENRKVINELQQDILTNSSSKSLDLYIRQTYLDNIIRGGYPVIFDSKSQKSVFYLYSRKHGDLERDYNKFLIQPTYFSQGNGNYRDMNQNRRCSVWFNPDINDEDLLTLFNLLQADGFNPLVVKGVSFLIKDELDLKTKLNDFVNESHIEGIVSFLTKPFSPGEFILFLEKNNINLKATPDEFLGLVLSYSEKIQEAEHGEGFWTDHWAYNLDLLESYLGIYPEKFTEILFDKKTFTFFDNYEIVKPRIKKYVLKDGIVKQLHSVVPDNAKKEMIRNRTSEPHVVRTQYGKGQIYRTSLVNKLLCLLANKLASLDPFGVGIEMEADKPNWFDALNGLPALFGSSLCETFELKRLVKLIKNALERVDREKIYITEEIFQFLTNLNTLIKEWLDSDNPDRDYQYWDKSYSFKENYREQTKLGFSGNESEFKTGGLISVLDNALLKIDRGIEKAFDKKRKIYYSYFINEVTEYDLLEGHFVRPKKFTQKNLPFFLGGQMHALRIAQNQNEAKKLYNAIRLSSLYDKKLKMYKITASLLDQPEEIGRCRSFTPGWLEHESIWLHMEYKYLLETLKSGLYEEFYEDFKNVLIPFQKPAKYGRSILENSSFIVSSAFPDKNLQGNGFVARLSGSTAEFLQIWLIMNVGIKPFYLNEKQELNLCFRPILAGWLFDRKGRYSFNFLSKIRVTYYNRKRKNTFGKTAAKIKKITFNDKNGSPVELLQNTIPSPYAEQIRSCLIKQIEIHFE